MSPTSAIRAALLTCCVGCCLCACGGDKPAVAAAIKPVKTDLVAHESELLRLTLTPDAVQRLGLQTVTIVAGNARQTRSVQGEVVAAPAAGGLPTSSAMDLGALGANQARADGDVARMRAELQVAERAFLRNEALVREEAGSIRARDEAEAALGVARANLQTAQAQRSLLGPRLVGSNGRLGLWVRAAVFASDLGVIDRASAAQVRALGGTDAAHSAQPVDGPPSANSSAGTLDLYYALSGNGQSLRIGQRVAVAVPLRGEQSGLLSPASAIVRDIYGGEWVYVRVGPHAFERRRVEVASLQDGQVRLARGLAPGAEVVSHGAMELFGAEFGSK